MFVAKDNPKKLTNGLHDQAFENTSTSVAASQMRNALNTLSDTVKDPQEKKVRDFPLDATFELRTGLTRSTEVLN